MTEQRANFQVKYYQILISAPLKRLRRSLAHVFWFYVEIGWNYGTMEKDIDEAARFGVLGKTAGGNYEKKNLGGIPLETAW